MSLKYVYYSPEKDLINGNHSIDEHCAQYLEYFSATEICLFHSF
jgi:hypothetical protein